MPSRSPRAGAIRPGSLVREGATRDSRQSGARSPFGDVRANRRVAWWSWPSLLALDAPIVGVAWLVAFGAHAGMPVGATAVGVVGVSIWLVYVADRLLDGARIAAADAEHGTAPAHVTPRHAFASRARGPLVAVWSIALVADVALAFATLPPLALVAGCAVAGTAAVTLDKRLRASPGGAALRAVLVGLAFAGAAAVGMGGAVPWEAVPALAAFGVACAANVALVGRWERHLCDGADGAPPPAFAAVGLAVFASAASTLLVVTSGGIVAYALAASTLTVVGLHAVHTRLAPDLARACADAALVAPLALLALATALSGAHA